MGTRRGPGRYVPLITIALILFLALAVLPSALNLPQSNPSTTLEYAPVPPSDKNQAPPGGNLASLGLASSGTVALGPGGTLPAGTGGNAQGVGKNPSTKRCVGKPPRQAEDLMSPPCVAYFNGDNGGATYAGVTASEITVAVLFNGAARANTGNAYATEQSPPVGTFCDIDSPPDTGSRECSSDGATHDHPWAQWTRAYAKYFNDRYQTYGRHVHYWVAWVATGSAELSRSNAANVYNKLHPFGVLNLTVGSNTYYSEFIDAMSHKGVFVFDGRAFAGTPNSFYKQYAPLVWGWMPDVEHWAQGFISYICTKVAPNPVAHAVGGVATNGQPFNGEPRRYGFLSTTDPSYVGLQQYAKLVKDGLAKCGVTPVVEGTFGGADPNSYYEGKNNSSQMAQLAAQFKQKDATTVLYLGSADEYFGTGADSVKYYPEVIVGSDGSVDRNLAARFQNQNFWRNAWVVANALRTDSLKDDAGVRACQEGDPQLDDRSCDFAAIDFRSHYLLFKVIQVAGPKLTPKSVDQGMHAIPKISSNSPYVASCFYDRDDYSCVKDFVEEWWDPSGTTPGVASPGCYRMPTDGKRFLAGTWTSGDDVFRNASDPCNAYSHGSQVFEP